MKIIKMEEKIAKNILNWQYDTPYDFYNMSYNGEALKELLDATYYTVFNEQNGLIGYFCFGENAQVPGGNLVNAYKEDAIDIGLGLRPDLTGVGLGYEFIQSGILFAREQFNPSKLRLSVALFNQRAIKVYTKAGFVEEKRFINKNREKEVEFITMELTIS